MKIQVTQGIINESLALIRAGESYCKNCPIAVAVRAETGFDCVVGGRVTVLNHYSYKRYDLPEIAEKFKNDFDACLNPDLTISGDIPKPFEFEL